MNISKLPPLHLSLLNGASILLYPRDGIILGSG